VPATSFADVLDDLSRFSICGADGSLLRRAHGPTFSRKVCSGEFGAVDPCAEFPTNL
jgi:hypothetical protein